MFAERIGELKERDSQIAIKIQSDLSSENVPQRRLRLKPTVMSFSFEISRLRAGVGVVAEFCDQLADFSWSRPLFTMEHGLWIEWLSKNNQIAIKPGGFLMRKCIAKWREQKLVRSKVAGWVWIERITSSDVEAMKHGTRERGMKENPINVWRLEQNYLMKRFRLDFWDLPRRPRCQTSH